MNISDPASRNYHTSIHPPWTHDNSEDNCAADLISVHIFFPYPRYCNCDFISEKKKNALNSNIKDEISEDDSTHALSGIEDAE